MITYKFMLGLIGSSPGIEIDGPYTVPFYVSYVLNGGSPISDATITGYPSSVAYTVYEVITSTSIEYFGIQSPTTIGVVITTSDDDPVPDWVEVIYQGNGQRSDYALVTSACTASTCRCNNIGWGTVKSASVLMCSGFVSQSGNVSAY